MTAIQRLQETTRAALARAVLAAVALLLAPTAPARAAETAEPTPDGMRIAMEIARRGTTWLVFVDGSRREIAGKIQLKEPRAIFHDAAGTLFSVRLADVDLKETEHFNKIVREGRWVDPATAAWSQARVRRDRLSDMWVRYLQMTLSMSDAVAADTAAACGGYSSETAQYLCGLERQNDYAAQAASRLGY